MNAVFTFFGGRKNFNFYLIVAILTTGHFNGKNIGPLGDALLLYFLISLGSHTTTDIMAMWQTFKTGKAPEVKKETQKEKDALEDK